MKIRQGFVSNSSSSSFLVLLNEQPKNIEHLRRLIFSITDYSVQCGDERIQLYIYDPYEKDYKKKEQTKITTEAVASYLKVPREICILSKKKRDRCKIVRFIQQALQSGQVMDKLLAFDKPPYPLYIRDEPKEEEAKKWKEWNQQEKEWSIKHAEFLADRLVETYPNKCLCRFAANDNEDGFVGMFTEHGNIFNHCDFWLQFSQH